MSERLLNMLGLMRKAGAIDIGETNTGGACRAGKAKVLLLAADASDNAQSRAAGTSARPRFHSRRKRYPRMSA